MSRSASNRNHSPVILNQTRTMHALFLIKHEQPRRCSYSNINDPSRFESNKNDSQVVCHQKGRTLGSFLINQARMRSGSSSNKHNSRAVANEEQLTSPSYVKWPIRCPLWKTQKSPWSENNSCGLLKQQQHVSRFGARTTLELMNCSSCRPTHKPFLLLMGSRTTHESFLIRTDLWIVLHANYCWVALGPERIASRFSSNSDTRVDLMYEPFQQLWCLKIKGFLRTSQNEPF